MAYCLGITKVDPIAHKLLFERFINEARALPDIDIDFDVNRREEVIQYLYTRYGADHAAMVCTVVRGRTAVLALGSGQLVMTLVMTMTPIHLHEAGHGLDIVGFVIGAHVLGMFGVAPISGWLTDRLGAPLVIGVGFAMLALAGVLAAVTPPAAGSLLAGPLFLLGAGWSFTFVAGSSLLSSAGSLAERARLQGATDALVWTVAAFASLTSGIVLDLVGYELMAVSGAASAVLLGLIIAGDRRSSQVSTSPG